MSGPVIKKDEVITSQQIQQVVDAVAAIARGTPRISITPRPSEATPLKQDRYELEASASVRKTSITVGVSDQKAAVLLTSGAIVKTSAVSFADAEFVLRRAGLVARNVSTKTFTIDISDKTFPNSKLLDGAEKMTVSVIDASDGAVQSAIVGLKMVNGEVVIIDTADTAILSTFTHSASEPIAQE